MSGLLQLDNKGQFYLISRNTKIDDMNPINVPEHLQGEIEELKQFIPYSVLFTREKAVSDKVRKEINEKLKNFIFQGQFVDWPLQS